MTFTNDEILSCFQPVTDGITAMMAYTMGEVFKTGNIIQENSVHRNTCYGK
uniref:Uncharacterized protein n=2 Tax=Fusarium oxysporum TaxID=5507 RepID=A0A0D2XIW3_FUSOF